jgi:hypothetical protein
VQIVVLSVDEGGHAANMPAGASVPPSDSPRPPLPPMDNLVSHPVPPPEAAPIVPAPQGIAPAIEPPLNLPRPVVPELSR